MHISPKGSEACALTWTATVTRDHPHPRRPDRSGGREEPFDPSDPERTQPMPNVPPPARSGRAHPAPRRPRRRPGRDPLDDPTLRRPNWAVPARERAAAVDPAAPLPRPQPPPAPAPPRNQRAATPPPPTPTTRGQDATAGDAPHHGLAVHGATRPPGAAPSGGAGAGRDRGAGAGAVLCLAVPLLFKSQQLISDIFVTPGPRPSVTGESGNVFPDWDKKERVNILLLGLDTREEDNTRSDTMIVVSIDPANKTVGMMSIPRDLWVSIPGFGENRINAAYQYRPDQRRAGRRAGPGRWRRWNRTSASISTISPRSTSPGSNGW